MRRSRMMAYKSPGKLLVRASTMVRIPVSVPLTESEFILIHAELGCMMVMGGGIHLVVPLCASLPKACRCYIHPLAVPPSA